jgi:hypothetical protein
VGVCVGGGGVYVCVGVCFLHSLHATSFRLNRHVRHLTLTCVTLDNVKEFEMYVEFS